MTAASMLPDRHAAVLVQVWWEMALCAHAWEPHAVQSLTGPAARPFVPPARATVCAIRPCTVAAAGTPWWCPPDGRPAPSRSFPLPSWWLLLPPAPGAWRSDRHCHRVCRQPRGWRRAFCGHRRGAQGRRRGAAGLPAGAPPRPRRAGEGRQSALWPRPDAVGVGGACGRGGAWRAGRPLGRGGGAVRVAEMGLD